MKYDHHGNNIEDVNNNDIKNNINNIVLIL